MDVFKKIVIAVALFAVIDVCSTSYSTNATSYSAGSSNTLSTSNAIVVKSASTPVLSSSSATLVESSSTESTLYNTEAVVTSSSPTWSSSMAVQTSKTTPSILPSSSIMPTTGAPSTTTAPVYVICNDTTMKTFESCVDAIKEKCDGDDYNVSCSNKDRCCQGLGNTTITLKLKEDKCLVKYRLVVIKKGENVTFDTPCTHHTEICKCGGAASVLTISLAIVVFGLFVHFF